MIQANTHQMHVKLNHMRHLLNSISEGIPNVKLLGNAVKAAENLTNALKEFRAETVKEKA